MDREWRPLFTERMAMENMGPLRRRLHIAFSRFHYRVSWALWPDPYRSQPCVLRLWFWVWHQYRRTWKLTR